ncbi:hypothetical protein OF846_005376 [Rhodotorula toruloides]|nr:hypothetical protein OF846_005376 [Rhodotorula toruloides]
MSLPPQTPSTPPLPLVHLFPSSCSRDPRRRAGRRARQLTMDPIVSPRRPSGPPTSSATPSLPHRLKAIPSSRTGVADVPLSPTGQKRFYSVHDGLLALAAETAAEAGDGPLDSLVQLDARPRSPDSEDEVTRMLVPPRRTALADTDTKIRVVARGTVGATKGADFGLYGFDGVDSAENGEEGDFEMQHGSDAEGEEPEKDVDGLPVEDNDLSMAPVATPVPPLEQKTQMKGVERGKNGSGGKKKGKKRKMETTDSEADQAGKVNHATLFLQDWRDNVSRLHPPHVWYTASHAPAPSASAPVERALGAESPLNVLYPSISSSISTLSTLARTGDLIGCTVTLTLPDSTTRTFSTPNVHASRRGARRTVFALAYESGVLDEAARMRAELGWDAEAAEENAEKESVRKMRGGERPWEALKAEQERWMAEPIKWRFETDELNSVHSCILTVPFSPSSPPLVFTTSQTFRSHREAKDAAARLALDANVPAQYEQAFKQRLNCDSGGYIQFGDITIADAAVADTHVDEQADEDGSERDGPLDSIALLNREVRAAFGGLKGWLDWKHKHAEDSTPQKTQLGATLTITFPITSAHPQPPAPFTVSVPPLYHTKHHARLACVAAAFRDGLVGRLEPYKREREEEKQKAQEERKRREEERRAERERGVFELPRAGTVKYEDLVKLENPSAYLNTCAQQWTGNGSPLKFAYSIQPSEGSIVKQYGCTVTVFVNIGLSKSYTVAPSPEMTTRRAAKDAAVRLALEEHVLDLLMPAGFDPNKPLATQRDVMEDAWAAPKDTAARPPSFVSAFNSDGLAGPLRSKRERVLQAGASTEAAPAAASVAAADESVGEPTCIPPPLGPFVAESEVDSCLAPAKAATSSASPPAAAATSKKTNPRWVQSPAGAAPFLATPPPARPSPVPVVDPEHAPPVLNESAVDRLDKLCISRLGYNYLPEYQARQSSETGLFAASVRIPLQASPLVESPFALRAPRPIVQQVVTFAVDFMYRSRAPAQEAVAELALRSDIITEWAADGESAATDASPRARVLDDQRVLLSVTQPASIPEKELPAAPANNPASLVADQPETLSKKRDCPDSGEATPATNREDPQKPVAKRAKLDVGADKQVSEEPDNVTAAEGLAPAESVEGGAGESVEILKQGCRDLLGPGVKFEPYYKASVEGSLFGATVFVCLDKNATDSRAFSLPALYASPHEAFEAVARIALQAGVLDLLESRVRPKARPASSPKDRREGRGGKKQAIPQRTEEEQAALRRASYGGFGAATAYQLAKMRALAEREKKLVEAKDQAPELKTEAPEEVPIEVEGNPLLPGLPMETEGEKVEGEATTALKAYFESRSLAFPTIYREPSSVPGKTTDRVRIWLVHEGLRFELPAAHVSKAEEKLASKVLKYLKEQEEVSKKAPKVARLFAQSESPEQTEEIILAYCFSKWTNGGNQFQVLRKLHLLTLYLRAVELGPKVREHYAAFAICATLTKTNNAAVIIPPETDLGRQAWNDARRPPRSVLKRILTNRSSVGLVTFSPGMSSGEVSDADVEGVEGRDSGDSGPRGLGGLLNGRRSRSQTLVTAVVVQPGARTEQQRLQAGAGDGLGRGLLSAPPNYDGGLAHYLDANPDFRHEARSYDPEVDFLPDYS